MTEADGLLGLKEGHPKVRAVRTLPTPSFRHQRNVLVHLRDFQGDHGVKQETVHHIECQLFDVLQVPGLLKSSSILPNLDPEVSPAVHTVAQRVTTGDRTLWQEVSLHIHCRSIMPHAMVKEPRQLAVAYIGLRRGRPRDFRWGGHSPGLGFSATVQRQIEEHDNVYSYSLRGVKTHIPSTASFIFRTTFLANGSSGECSNKVSAECKSMRKRPASIASKLILILC